MEIFGLELNLILVVLPLAAFANLILGTIVYIHNRQLEVNRVFFFLILSTVAWIGGIIVRFSGFPKEIVLIGARITFLGAPFIAALIFYFSAIFLYPRVLLKKSYKTILMVSAVVLGVAGMFTKLVVRDIDFVANSQMTYYGPLYYVFVIYFLSLIIWGIVLLAIKHYKTTGIEKIQIRLIFIGLSLALMFGVVTNILVPLITGNSSISRLGPLETSFFIFFATYAIIKRHLLNVKVVATEMLTVSMWIIVLLRIVLAPSFEERIISSVLLILLVLLGIMLMRSVLNEVRAREEIEKLAKELEFANKELKRLDAAKSEFISIASHQLRTPLSIVKGYISMIREGNYGEVRNPILKTINKVYLSNERLIKLVADLLDLSRMESGKLQYEFANFDFANLVDSIVDEFKNPVHDKGLQLVWTKPSNSFVIWGDSMKLRQVIFNLVDNSLKYTQKGSIEVSVQKSNTTVAVSVKDTGVGMTPETAHSLFQKFSRGKDSSRVNTEGLGLGLFIAKKIVDDHRGELTIMSEGDGKGSTFTLTLPIKKYVDPVAEFNNFMTNI